MRLYISADMEGIAGHTGWNMVRPGELYYGPSRARMTREVNAAVGGALSAGVTEVVVNDSHDGMRNLIYEELHPAARLLSGAPKPWSMVEGLDEHFDLAFFIGYHAMGGGDGVLAHTYSLDPISCRINGIEVGETGINALVAGHFGVPVALVSGDDVLGEEVAALLPHAQRVVVKQAKGRFGALHLSPGEVAGALREGAAAAVAAPGPPLQWAAPYALELELPQAGAAMMAAVCPGAQRISARTVGFTAPDIPTLFRAFRTMLTLGGAGRD